MSLKQDSVANDKDDIILATNEFPIGLTLTSSWWLYFLDACVKNVEKTGYFFCFDFGNLIVLFSVLNLWELCEKSCFN